MVMIIEFDFLLFMKVGLLVVLGIGLDFILLVDKRY